MQQKEASMQAFDQQAWKQAQSPTQQVSMMAKTSKINALSGDDKNAFIASANRHQSSQS